VGLNDKTARRFILILEKPFLPRRGDKDQYEVDIVAEDLSGRVMGVEVKASATVRGEDFRGLRKLADAAGEDFRLGGDFLMRIEKHGRIGSPPHRQHGIPKPQRETPSQGGRFAPPTAEYVRSCGAARLLAGNTCCSGMDESAHFVRFYPTPATRAATMPGLIDTMTGPIQ